TGQYAFVNLRANCLDRKPRGRQGGIARPDPPRQYRARKRGSGSVWPCSSTALICPVYEHGLLPGLYSGPHLGRRTWRMTVMPLVVLATWLAFTSVETPSPSSSLALPSEPDESTRIDEIYDQESRLLLSLYSLKGNGKADYVTGRTVEQHV